MLKHSFLRRSIDAIRSQSQHLKLDPEHYSAVLPMVTFPDADSILRNCAIGSDNDTGGYSTANLEHVVEDGIPCLRFSGTLSLHVPPEARKRGMTHSGWAGWRTRPMGANLFNRHPTWDTSLLRFLSLRVKGDDRRYYINVQTDSLDPIELWQHRLFLRTPGQWETVLIPWADFLRTRNGRISYKKFDGMDRERVKTVGASLIERKEGPYCLHVAEIKSVNTHGFQGPMPRYTPEEGQKFIEEEAKRDAEETAAYFAWKRGETPIGTEPVYQPPEPGKEPYPLPRGPTVVRQTAPPPNPGAPQGYPTEAEAPTNASGAPSGAPQDPVKHLFDDPLFEEEGELHDVEKVDIDTVDIDDSSPEGRKRRMRAMADELQGFSAGQRKEAEELEEARTIERKREGRKVLDKFGQIFEDAPPPRRRR